VEWAIWYSWDTVGPLFVKQYGLNALYKL
jgi:hypothetical protein